MGPEITQIPQQELDRELMAMTLDDIRESVQGIAPGAQFIEGRTTRIGVLPAVYASVIVPYRGMGVTPGFLMRSHFIYMLTQRGMFTVGCGADVKSEPRYRKILFRILNSFTVVRQ